MKLGDVRSQEARIEPLGFVDREEWIVARCRHQRVLHLGAADYPLTHDRLKNGRLLHQRIEDAAKEVIGIDVSAEAIGILRAAGVSTVYLGDAEKLSAAPLRGAFDVVVAGELMEHLENPGCFLEGVRGVLTRGGSLLVTTANALSVLGAMRAMLGREIVHPEHTFYFSQRTLSELCSRYDFKCVEYGFYAPPTRSALKKAMRRPLESWWRHLSPWSAPGLVARYEGRTT